MAHLGAIAALRELGLWREVRYMGGVSGGAWAVAAFAYAQHGYGTPQSPLNVTTLLGRMLAPQEATMRALEAVQKGSARTAATWSLYDQLMKYALDPFCKGGRDKNTSCNGDQLWTKAVSAREQQIRGSGGSLEPPGSLLELPRPLLTHLHTVYIAYSECLPTRLNPPG